MLQHGIEVQFLVFPLSVCVFVQFPSEPVSRLIIQLIEKSKINNLSLQHPTSNRSAV
jgi:hypothetical protein